MYGFASWRLYSLNIIKGFSYVHSLVGVILLTGAFYLLLDDDILLLVLAAEAAALHLTARRLSDRRAAISAHLLFGALGLWLIAQLFSGQAPGTVIFNTPAMTDLWVIATASVVFIRAISSVEGSLCPQPAYSRAANEFQQDSNRRHGNRTLSRRQAVSSRSRCARNHLEHPAVSGFWGTLFAPELLLSSAVEIESQANKFET